MTPRPGPTPEQALAIALRAPFLLVSASAGTGKTRTLVDKVIGALRDGVALDRILAITFTHKAAEQLRASVHEAFDRDAELRPQRLRLPQAQVSTIDAFCARLLREHAAAAGVDPAFRVLADPEDARARAEILDEIFHHWYLGRSRPAAPCPARGSAAHHEFLRLIELCAYRGGQEVLKLEVERLLLLARAHADPGAFLDALERGLAADRPPYLVKLAAELRRAWGVALDAYRTLLEIAAKDLPGKSLAKQRDFLVALEGTPWPDDETFSRDPAAAIEGARRHLDRAGALSADGGRIAFPHLPGGTRASLGPWNELAKALAGGTRQPRFASPFAWLPADPSEIARGHARIRPALETLLALLRQAMEAYESHKREQGLLDFADLELHARRLLADPPDALRERFDLVFVDEYQDVSPLQAEIVRLLAPVRGRFLVGDVKQCIYQFRLSDPSVFRGLCRDAPVIRPDADDPQAERRRGQPPVADRVRVFLSTNFRSREVVLDQVNRTFGALFRPEMIGGAYADEALRPGAATSRAAWPDDEPIVEIHLLEKPGPSEPSAPPALEREARLVARRIREILAAGLPVRVKDSPATRPVTCDDIAVLLRSPGPTGAAFARLLREQGVPVRFGGQGFFDREETRDFMNLLRVLDNAHDDVALASILRAPMLGFSDADLARLRLAWPEAFSLLAALRATAAGAADAWSGPGGGAGEPLAARCRAVLEALERWRRRAQAADLPEAIGAAMEESGLLETAAGAEDGAARVGNLQQLLTLVREHCRERDHSLPGLLRYLATAAAGAGALECVSVETDAAPAVQLLSLHKAKGLEFPVVVLALTGRGFNETDARARVLTGESWLGVDILDPETYLKTPTVAREMLAWKRRRALLEEELRILYVALTRARDKLVVTGTLSASWATRLEDLALWRAPGAPPEPLIYGARSPLQWIMGVLARDGDIDALTPADLPIAPRPGVRVVRHSAAGDPGAPAASAGTGAGALSGVDEPALGEVARRVEAAYPHAAATRWRGKFWATEIKRLADRAAREQDREQGTEVTRFVPAGGDDRGGVDPLAEGAWIHAVLEELDFAAAPDPAALLDHARRLAERGRVPREWVSEARLAPIARFLATPRAAELREAAVAGRLEREVPFALKLRPSELAALWPDAGELPDEEWLLVQGQIDAVWTRADGSAALLDFKTDRVATPEEAAARAAAYRPQLWIYRRAVERLWRPERLESFVCFLRCGIDVAIG
jgi:ATP-dependent helicase/nuclease subunit A